MKEYNVKAGGEVVVSNGFKTLKQAKAEVARFKEADSAYDICRSDGWYKIVVREIGPWRIVKDKKHA